MGEAALPALASNPCAPCSKLRYKLLAITLSLEIIARLVWSVRVGDDSSSSSHAASPVGCRNELFEVFDVSISVHAGVLNHPTIPRAVKI
jgi:hypothetical protein